MKHLKKQIEEMEQLVMSVTGLSEEQLYQLKFDLAYDFLDKVVGTDSFGLNQLPKTREFWGHWKLVWHWLDVELFEGSEEKPATFQIHPSMQHWTCQCSVGPVVIQDMLSTYLQHHEANHIGLQLNSVLLERSWHQTIKDIANNSKKEYEKRL